MARTNAEGDDLILDQQLHRFLERLRHLAHANDASVGTPQRGRPPGREYVAALAALMKKSAGSTACAKNQAGCDHERMESQVAHLRINLAPSSARNSFSAAC